MVVTAGVGIGTPGVSAGWPVLGLPAVAGGLPWPGWTCADRGSGAAVVPGNGRVVVTVVEPAGPVYVVVPGREPVPPAPPKTPWKPEPPAPSSATMAERTLWTVEASIPATMTVASVRDAARE